MRVDADVYGGAIDTDTDTARSSPIATDKRALSRAPWRWANWVISVASIASSRKILTPSACPAVALR